MPMNITEFCSELPTAHFCCHRSYCVNLSEFGKSSLVNNTYALRLRDRSGSVSRSKVKEFAS